MGFGNALNREADVFPTRLKKCITVCVRWTHDAMIDGVDRHSCVQGHINEGVERRLHVQGFT